MSCIFLLPASGCVLRGAALGPDRLSLSLAAFIYPIRNFRAYLQKQPKGRKQVTNSQQ